VNLGLITGLEYFISKNTRPSRETAISGDPLRSTDKLARQSGGGDRLAFILARAGHFWVYEYLFAKQDRANIEDDELAGFRRLVKAYAGLTTQQVNQLLRNRNWMEICNDGQT
jgi:hypothetical protein